jgi:hypothetical protein
MHSIFSWIIAGLFLAAAVGFLIQGDIAVSLSQFGGWMKPKLRKTWLVLRNIRRLVNVPFHMYLHRQTRMMPLCLGQVWAGANRTVRIIGKASNGDWVLELSKDIQAIESTFHLRNRIHDEVLYLYEWDKSISYVPTITSINGLQAVVLKRY